MLENGDSIHKIAAKLGVGKSTIGEIRSGMELPMKENHGGRPSKLTPHDHRHLVRLVTTGKADTATQFRCQLLSMNNTPLSTQTIQNSLKKEDLVARVKVKKPFLSAKHRKARMEFAEKYEHWTEEDWARVMFTDETKIN